MTDLIEFLLARLHEDEVAARLATSGPWRYNPGKEWFTDLDKLRAARSGVPQDGGEEFVGAGPIDATIGVAATGPADHPQSMADAHHIARHDPARVLREAQAKRRIVDGYVEAKRHSDLDQNEQWAGGYYLGIEEAVLAMASVYSDHPDYRPEWAPSGAPNAT